MAEDRPIGITEATCFTSAAICIIICDMDHILEISAGNRTTLSALKNRHITSKLREATI
jgi:hypothetical protein